MAQRLDMADLKYLAEQFSKNHPLNTGNLPDNKKVCNDLSVLFPLLESWPHLQKPLKDMGYMPSDLLKIENFLKSEVDALLDKLPE